MKKQLDDHFPTKKELGLVQAKIDTELLKKIWQVLDTKKITMRAFVSGLFQKYLDEQKQKR